MNFASASSSSTSGAYASAYPARPRTSSGVRASARTSGLWFAVAMLVSSMNSGGTDAAVLSRCVASGVAGMRKCGICSRQRRSSSMRSCAVAV
jgi:hypothetical protein